jgi:hypothetical protein
VAFVNDAVAFVNDVTAGCVTVNLDRIGKGSSTEQDLKITNNNVKLYAHMSIIPVSNGAGLDTSPLIKRKNALCRNLIINIDETVLINTKFITARRSVIPIMALIPTKVITSASLKNLVVDFTKKE